MLSDVRSMSQPESWYDRLRQALLALLMRLASRLCQDSARGSNLTDHEQYIERTFYTNPTSGVKKAGLDGYVSADLNRLTLGIIRKNPLYPILNLKIEKQYFETNSILTYMASAEPSLGLRAKKEQIGTGPDAVIPESELALTEAGIESAKEAERLVAQEIEGILKVIG